jgi:hypothetical protein
MRNAAVGNGDLLLSFLTAAIFDLKVGIKDAGGVAVHIGLATSPNDVIALIDIWSELPDYEGDALGVVYMAAIHR